MKLEKEQREERERKEAEEKAKADKRKNSLLSRKTSITRVGGDTSKPASSNTSLKRTNFNPRSDAKLPDK